MPEAHDVTQFQAELARLDALLGQGERDFDPATQTRIREIVQGVLALHASGLERLLDLVAESHFDLFDAFAHDELVSGLLMLHGLHPLELEDRVRQALEQVRPALRSHGGSVELLGVDGGVVRLRLDGNCHGCPSSSVTMRQTVEEAICAHAPEVTAIEVEGLVESSAPMPAFDSRLTLPLVSN